MQFRAVNNGGNDGGYAQAAPRASSGSRRIAVRVALFALLALILWLVIRSALHGWTPAREDYPVQGVSLSAANGPVDWAKAKADGVDFVYLSATSGAIGRDSAFEANRKGAGAMGVRFGAVHHFDLCSLAGEQANTFVTTVPRMAAALPPVIALEFAPTCTDRPGRAVVLSELNTLLNLIEAHSEKPAVLRISKDFDDLYQVSQGVHRTVWLEGSFMPPDYAAKPFVLWSANNDARIDGVDGPVEWLVVRPTPSPKEGGAQ